MVQHHIALVLQTTITAESRAERLYAEALAEAPVLASARGFFLTEVTHHGPLIFYVTINGWYTLPHSSG